MSCFIHGTEHTCNNDNIPIVLVPSSYSRSIIVLGGELFMYILRVLYWRNYELSSVIQEEVITNKILGMHGKTKRSAQPYHKVNINGSLVSFDK